MYNPEVRRGLSPSQDQTNLKAKTSEEANFFKGEKGVKREEKVIVLEITGV